MTLRLDPNDPTKTKIQYRDPKPALGTPRILYVADEPDVYQRQIVILNGDGSMGLRCGDGRWSPDGKSERDIINAPPDAEELLMEAVGLIRMLSPNLIMPDWRLRLWLSKYEEWEASR